jgi:phage baseplate assembly protein gpV
VSESIRSKRTAPVKAWVTPELREQIELFISEESHGNVLSMSDYVFGVLEQHVAVRHAMRKSPVRVSHQIIRRRVGNS